MGYWRMCDVTAVRILEKTRSLWAGLVNERKFNKETIELLLDKVWLIYREKSDLWIQKKPIMCVLNFLLLLLLPYICFIKGEY